MELLWLFIALGAVGLFGYLTLRFLRGDWSAASVEDRPEDSAYDDDDDFDDADVGDIDEDEDDEDY